MNIDSNQTCEKLLALFRFCNTITGLPIFAHSYPNRRILQIALEIYQWITEIIVILATAPIFWAIPNVWPDIDLVCACLAPGSHAIQVVFKTFLLRKLKQQYGDHLEHTNELLKKSKQFELRLLSLQESYKLIFEIYHRTNLRFAHWCLSVLFILNVFASMGYFVPITVESIIRYDNLTDQESPIIFYFHYDFMHTPAFQLVNVYQTISFHYMTLRSLSMDMSILAIITLHAVQFRYLNYLLLQLMQNVSDSLVAKDHITAWVQLHQKHLKLVSNLAKLLSPYLLLEFLYILIHTCIPAFVITSTPSWTMIQKICVIFITWSGFVIFFLMSRAGDSLTNAINATAKPLYTYEAFDTREKWRQLVLSMTTSRSQISLKLHAAMYSLTCTTFVSMSRLIVACYMALNEVQRIKANKEDKY